MCSSIVNSIAIDMLRPEIEPQISHFFTPTRFSRLVFSLCKIVYTLCK